MAAERSFKVPTVPVGRRRFAASSSKTDSEESTSGSRVETATEVKTEVSSRVAGRVGISDGQRDVGSFERYSCRPILCNVKKGSLVSIVTAGAIR